LRPRSLRTAIFASDPEAIASAIDESPSLLPNPEQSLASANEHAVVHAMIDALPEELRLPLVLSAFDELNSREIANILKIPEGTVRTRLQRARQMLRQKLQSRRETRYA